MLLGISLTSKFNAGALTTRLPSSKYAFIQRARRLAEEFPDFGVRVSENTKDFKSPVDIVPRSVFNQKYGRNAKKTSKAAKKPTGVSKVQAKGAGGRVTVNAEKLERFEEELTTKNLEKYEIDLKARIAASNAQVPAFDARKALNDEEGGQSNSDIGSNNLIEADRATEADVDVEVYKDAKANEEAATGNKGEESKGDAV